MEHAPTRDEFCSRADGARITKIHAASKVRARHDARQASVLRYRPRLVSGFRPAGDVHIGTYFGAVSHIVTEQNRHPGITSCLIADLHAVTGWKPGSDLAEQTLRIAAALLALDVDPSRTIVFAQSRVPEITELLWLLACLAPASVLKESSATLGGAKIRNAGVLVYPLLMAGDVLAMRGTMIAVGRDQLINARSVRAVARAANFRLDQPVFPVPDILSHATVPGVDGAKMDVRHRNEISPFWSYGQISERIDLIRTDSKGARDPKDPGECTVFRLYALTAPERQVETMRERYLGGGISYHEAKRELAIAIAERFAEPAERFKDWMKRRDDLLDILRAGARTASAEARATLALVRERMGLKL